MKLLIGALLLLSSTGHAQFHLKIDGLVKSRSQVRFTEIEDYADRLDISFTARGSAKKEGRIFAEKRAEMRALKEAKIDGAISIGTLCKDFVPHDNDIDWFNKDCSVEGESVSCTIEGRVNCQGNNQDEMIYAKTEHGLIDPSTGCVERFKQNFKLDQDLVDRCNKIQTIDQFKCVSQLAEYPSVKLMSINACSAFESSRSVEVLRAYARKRYGVPSPILVMAFAGVNTQEEATCIQNKMEVGQFTVGDLEKKCLNDSPLELDEREYNALGFVISPRTSKYGISKPIEDTAGGILGRIRDFFN